MVARKAKCSCGALGLTTEGDPVRVSICHCDACQRRTGSPFAQQARFPKENVSIQGESRVYERVAESGNRARFHFCGNCGATVFYELEIDPANYGIPVGVFADPEFPEPWISVYETNMHDWIQLPDGIEHYD